MGRTVEEKRSDDEAEGWRACFVCRWGDGRLEVLAGYVADVFFILHMVLPKN